MNSKFIETFKAARRISTPLIAAQTADPSATMKSISDAAGECPKLSWDIIRGLSTIGNGKKSQAALQELCGEVEPSMTNNPAEVLERAARKLPPDSILFFQNAQQYLDSPAVVQGIWNLRDLFKTDMRTLVMLCPSITLPPELAQDVLIIDEPLPTPQELTEIVKSVFESGGLEPPDEKVTHKAVDALSGLAAFPAEQATAMSLSKDGLDIRNLWDRKQQAIEQTPGLSVYKGGEGFDDIGGIQNIKEFLNMVINGKKPPAAILFIDEIEKALAGSSGDLSGVSQEMLGQLLQWMQDQNVSGIIAIGPPGCAKSMIAKATGNTAGVPTIRFDLSAMKGSLVGESAKRLRTALKVVDSVSSGKVFCIATCNSLAALPPELRRRFKKGIYFFDLPNKEERETIWALYKTKYNLDMDQEHPEDEGWTGAEIQQCCELADEFNTSLKVASMFIVPVSVSAKETINKLRREASGKFVSASYPGTYRFEETASSHGRKMEL